MASRRIAIIGGGPAGLRAAEVLSAAGHAVTVYERKPAAGRKFLMAGRGGLNLTHSEPPEKFLTRYGSAAAFLQPMIESFSAQDLRGWCEGLGQPVFTGTSGRVFPEALKASPLLRAWQARLEQQGVVLKTRKDWQGWDDAGNLAFADGETATADAVLLALGGASWPRLGADGTWTKILAARGVRLSPLRPSNCGFLTGWSDIFARRFAGVPLKSVVLHACGQSVAGEIMLTESGVEGGAVYALSAPLRDAIDKDGEVFFHIDLKPALTQEDLAQKLSAPRGTATFSNWLRKQASLPPAAINLLREAHADPTSLPAADLARLIKRLPLRAHATAGMEKAISCAGGIALDGLDGNLMLKKMPGVFAAGEMLDWEAPTGGYLLQACFSTGTAAAQGMIRWLSERP